MPLLIPPSFCQLCSYLFGPASSVSSLPLYHLLLIQIFYLEKARPGIMKLLIPNKEALGLILLLVESWNLAGNAFYFSLCFPSLGLSNNSFAISLILLVETSFADCYDLLDPNGNITVTFDISQWTHEGYVARVTIQNYYQYRHVEMPGWSLGWTWAEKEVIESMAGALATQQGDCSGYKYRTLHCCKRDPVIIDLMPDAAPENRTANCCRGGILSAWAIDQPTSFSSFIMVVAGLDEKAQKPQNLTFLAPGLGYTCGPLEEHTPTVVPVVQGRREEQAFNEAAIFWGLEYYNKELLQAGDKEPGSVMTEMVMHKDPESFTLRNGWAFPRKVYFNGEICEMPMPDDFPRLPNTSSRPSNACYLVFILCSLILLFHL